MSYQVKIDNEVLEKRLEELGATLYTIAKKVGEIRGENSQVSRWHSATSKVVEKPLASKLTTIMDVVRAMGGKIIIEWDEVENMDQLLDYRVDERIGKVEKSVEEIKDLLVQLIASNENKKG
jgi:hypothetical protein